MEKNLVFQVLTGDAQTPYEKNKVTATCRIIEIYSLTYVC